MYYHGKIKNVLKHAEGLSRVELVRAQFIYCAKYDLIKRREQEKYRPTHSLCALSLLLSNTHI